MVRVVNTDPTAPDGSLEISEVNIVNADGTAKAGEITNTYAAYGLSVVKHLSGNFANAGDEFTFTIALDDPDETPHASSVTVKTGGEAADFSTITGDTVTFNADGTAEVKADITGGEKIEVTGCPLTRATPSRNLAIQRQVTPPPGTASPKPQRRQNLGRPDDGRRGQDHHSHQQPHRTHAHGPAAGRCALRRHAAGGGHGQRVAAA